MHPTVTKEISFKFYTFMNIFVLYLLNYRLSGRNVQALFTAILERQRGTFTSVAKDKTQLCSWVV